MKKRLPLALLVAAALSACQADPAPAAPDIADPWARETVDGQMMAAAYFTITNPGPNDLRITRVETPAAQTAGFHRSMVENGVATMKALDNGLVVEAGETAALEPGGDHVMLEGLHAPLVAGTTIDLTLVFEGGKRETIKATIVKAGER